MVKTLLERVIDFVVANPAQTLPEIARGVRARDGAIRDILSSERFSASVRDENEHRSPQVYRLAPGGADGLGLRQRRTQCDLIAAVLADREWHTTAEIHHRCGFSRLNSRVADLRKRRGMVIDCRHVDGEHSGPNAYEYRLIGTASEASEAADTLTGGVEAPRGESAASDGPAAQLSPDADPLLTEAAGPSDSQLDLGEAA